MAQVKHLALIGDSILDNKLYSKRTRCVTEHLRAKLACGEWAVTNCAVDGAVIRDVYSQLGALPESCDLLVLSAGGNDGLQLLGSLQEEGITLGSLLRKISTIQKELRREYEGLISAVLQRGVPTVVCTVYRPCLRGGEGRSCGRDWGEGAGFWSKQLVATISLLGIKLLNRIIRQAARRHRLPLIDLASVFNHSRDYANPIEPSVWGGDKITENVLLVLKRHDFDRPRFAVYRSRRYSASDVTEGPRICPRKPDAEVSEAEDCARSSHNERFRRVSGWSPGHRRRAEAAASSSSGGDSYSAAGEAGIKDSGDGIGGGESEPSMGSCWPGSADAIYRALELKGVSPSICASAAPVGEDSFRSDRDEEGRTESSGSVSQ